jgi:hypothetical protein
MMLDDILADEFAAAAAAVKREDFDYLRAQGVPRQWLWGGPMRFGIAEIITSGPTYQPVRGGKRAVVVPAIPLRDDLLDDDPGDLIAWFPDNPSRWWCRYGTVPFLNYEAVERAAFFHEPLSLWSSPTAWLQASGRGAVILEPNTHLSLWLGDIATIEFDKADLARQVRAKMTAEERRLPEFRVLADTVEAAE